jgi:hypothetical protein
MLYGPPSYQSCSRRWFGRFGGIKSEGHCRRRLCCHAQACKVEAPYCEMSTALLWNGRVLFQRVTSAQAVNKCPHDAGFVVWEAKLDVSLRTYANSCKELDKLSVWFYCV